MNDCLMTERSARGDCPGDTLHAEQICEEVWAEAPFCSGPSMTECPNGQEVPETDSCNSSSPDPVENAVSCELDGTCDDGEGALDGYEALTGQPLEGVAEVGQPQPLDVLPATGLTDAGAVVLFGLASIAAGVGLLKNARR